MTDLEFRSLVQQGISEFVHIGERATQPPDCGEETEADMRERFAEEWHSGCSKADEFLEDHYELTLAIARAARAYDATPSELMRLELVRAVDAARETYIEHRRTRG